MYIISGNGGRHHTACETAHGEPINVGVSPPEEMVISFIFPWPFLSKKKSCFFRFSLLSCLTTLLFLRYVCLASLLNAPFSRRRIEMSARPPFIPSAVASSDGHGLPIFFLSFIWRLRGAHFFSFGVFVSARGHFLSNADGGMSTRRRREKMSIPFLFS